MLQNSFQRCCEENDQMSTGCVHQMASKNWQPEIRTKQNSALQCSCEQKTDDSPNREVLDNLNYVKALEGELLLKILVYASF